MNKIKKLSIETLMIEVTRRCNMNCSHCLRGNSQNLDIEKKTIDKLLDNVYRIGNITFSGGEITLNLRVIKYFFDEIKRRDISCDSYWMATNGKENQYELLDILIKNYDLMEDKESNRVAISKDKYHEYTNISPISFLSFYDDCKEHDKNESDDWILYEGNAIENQIDLNEIDRRYYELSEVEIYKDYIEIESMYINALGEIVPHCDYSYKNQIEMKVGNVNNIEDFILKISDKYIKCETVEV